MPHTNDKVQVEETKHQEPFSFFSSENPITFFSPVQPQPQFTPEELQVPITEIYKNFLES